MSVNKSCFCCLIGLLLAVDAAAVENLGGHFRDPDEFRQVIDTRCLKCHDAERIEESRRRQEAIEPLQRRMAAHGAVLTEKDRQVLGTFWGSPLKDRDKQGK